MSDPTKIDSNKPNQITSNDETIDGNLFVTGKIGIGTSQPGPKLDVQGEGTVGIRYLKSGSKDARIAVGDPGKAWSVAVGWANQGDFSIIEEGVAGDRLYIKQGGNVGIGTTNPQSMLHIGDGLPPQPSGGYRPWMVRGTLVSWNTDNVFFGLKDEGPDRKDAVIAWGDNSNDSSNSNDAFRFIFTANQGPADGQEIMRLQPTGNVGIGTAKPEAKLHLIDSFRGSIKLLATSGVGHDFGYNGGGDSLFWFTHYGQESGETKFRWDTGTGNRDLLTIKNTGNIGIGTTSPSEKLEVVGNIKVTGTVIQASSRELKENIAELSTQEAIEALKNLNAVKFNYKADSEKNLHIGFIAEEAPDLVATSDRKGLSSMDIVAVLTEVVKEQQKTMAALAEKIQLLEAQTA